MDNKDSKEDKNTDSNIGSDSNSSDDKDKGEYGGPKGPEPTRYGDWEKDGRCVDF
jgi:hypothetical protein